MAARISIAALAIALLAGCSQQPESNASNTVLPSAETRNAASEAGPLSKDQALALMKQRHDNMDSLGTATKKAKKALDPSSPDIATLQQSAAQIDELSAKLLSWFPAGTGPDVGKTRAKPEIWQKQEDFALKAHDFETAAKQFDVAAKGGDVGQINSTFDALGKACKACHDLYRAPEKH